MLKKFNAATHRHGASLRAPRLTLPALPASTYRCGLGHPRAGCQLESSTTMYAAFRDGGWRALLLNALRNIFHPSATMRRTRGWRDGK